ncbi:hypothetical protein B0H11DRAFT_2184889 [Mycena galericulata]|nr:hypothetical protein B0H11DRAFT_2184889 [Mycena galericulata]
MRVASNIPFSSINGLFQQDAYIYAARELEGRYAFTSPDLFIQEHLPDSPAGQPPSVDSSFLMKIANSNLERDMYTPLISALQPLLKPGWKLENTSDSADPDSAFILDQLVKPDISLYSDEQPSNGNLCRACDMECFLELKTDLLDDPFADTGTREKDSARARDSRGQLITYLNAIQASQFRTYVFGVIVVKNKCRLLRLTRSGIEVTSSFDYTSSNLLNTFLWRLSRATPETRGIDTTYERVHRDDARVAREILDAVGRPLWLVSVGDDYYYVSAPFTRAHHYPVGRGTRCFVAVDAVANQKLHRHNVRNIAQVVAASDVGEQSCGTYPPTWHVLSGGAIRKHQHYRIVLDVVGKSLTQFPSTHALVGYILDALEAHYDAFTKAGVEHRDVSAGNIVIVPNADGTFRALLIDWELAKFQEDGSARAYERTGTRQFMSARLCADSPPARTLGDDIESFVLVLMWLATAYGPSTMTPSERAFTLQIFDDPGAVSKTNMLMAGEGPVRRLLLESSHLEDVLCELLEGLKNRYLPPRRNATPEMKTDLAQKVAILEDHSWVIQVLENALENKDWAATMDPGSPQKVAVLKPAQKKRKSDLSEYQQVFEKKRKQEGERGPDEDEEELDVFSVG